MGKQISRRDFLKGSLKVTGLTVAVSLTPLGFKLLNASEDKEGMLKRFKPNAWFEITPDNSVTITIGNSEMGQGVLTALPMIIADELEADWKRVKIVQGPASKAFQNPIHHMQITVASASVRGFYEPLRNAAAAGRAMLIEAAAQTWGVPKASCEAVLGVVRNKKSGKELSYGQLCLKAATLKVPEKPSLKPKSRFRYMGKPMPRVDIPDKVSGKAVFGFDVDMPDLHYAILSRPPAYGAKPSSFDEKGAMAVNGVKKVVPTPHGIAVCADSFGAALKGREALKTQWGPGVMPQLDNRMIEASLVSDLDKPGATVRNQGDAKSSLGKAEKKIEATYYIPYIAHATMEPMNCTAHVQKDRCDIWAPTQGQTVAQLVGSKVSGIPPENVHIHTTMLGCGLGRRAAPDFVIEAVIASKVLGKPVKLVWTREEDFKYDFFRAAMAHRLEAGVDGNGTISGWSQKVVAPSILKYIAPDKVKGGIDFYSLWGLADYPFSPHNNNMTYQFDNFYVEFLISELPPPVAPWRSVQNAPNAFVIESFMDEMAHLAGKDPLAFRLAHLKNNMRARRVLKTVAEKAGWGKKMPKGQGLGIAQHSCFGTYVAQVAHVTVNKDGTIKVNRMDVAVDCGPVVNPGPLKAQMEGGIIMGISTALKEEIKFEKGGVATNNYEDYDLIRMSEVPEIHVHLLDSSEKIGGIGEPGVPPSAPAVANAVFAASGARLRRIPMTPDRVLKAIAAA
jgi:isoquinoline 1-oxidoreductase beta subunit